MTDVATKNGSVVVNDGSIAERCECCGPPPEVPGACCRGYCQPAVRSTCSSFGGTFYGEGTSCYTVATYLNQASGVEVTISATADRYGWWVSSVGCGRDSFGTCNFLGAPSKIRTSHVVEATKMAGTWSLTRNNTDNFLVIPLAYRQANGVAGSFDPTETVNLVVKPRGWYYYSTSPDMPWGVAVSAYTDAFSVNNGFASSVDVSLVAASWTAREAVYESPPPGEFPNWPSLYKPTEFFFNGTRYTGWGVAKGHHPNEYIPDFYGPGSRPSGDAEGGVAVSCGATNLSSGLLINVYGKRWPSFSEIYNANGVTLNPFENACLPAWPASREELSQNTNPCGVILPGPPWHSLGPWSGIGTGPLRVTGYWEGTATASACSGYLQPGQSPASFSVAVPRTGLRIKPYSHFCQQGFTIGEASIVGGDLNFSGSPASVTWWNWFGGAAYGDFPTVATLEGVRFFK